MKIQSNLQTAEHVTTRMKNASELIQNAIHQPISKTNKTTVTVNMKAQEANEEAIKIVQMFHNCFLETIENIQSAAKEFERTDQELQQSINKLLPNQKLLNDIRTYHKAKNG